MIDDDSEGKAEEADAVAQAQKALESGEKLTTYFADALDEIYGPSRAPTISTAERERIERDDEAFRIMLRQAVADNLRGHGFMAVRVSAMEGGYQLQAMDREGRRYETTFEFDLIDECDGSVRTLFDRVTTAILAERDRYFKRMQ